MYISFSHGFGFCDRSANSPARMRNSSQIDTPLSSRARALWRSFFLLFYRHTHSLCACLSACSDIYDMSHSIRAFFLTVLKGYIDESNIKAPTATSKCRLTPSEDAWVRYCGRAARLPGQSSQMCNICDRKGYKTSKLKH